MLTMVTLVRIEMIVMMKRFLSRNLTELRMTGSGTAPQLPSLS